MTPAEYRAFRARKLQARPPAATACAKCDAPALGDSEYCGYHALLAAIFDAENPPLTEAP